MRRRQFISLLGGAAVWPIAAVAQQGGRRIGVLMPIAETDPEARVRVEAFRRGLGELGWKEGRNVHIEFRWAADNVRLMRTHAAELVRLAPDVIVALSPPGLAAVQQETGSLPIVFVQVPDPVGGGFVANLAQPGGNTTGFSSFEETISAKWLELLKEFVPQISRVAILRNPAPRSSSQFLMGAIEARAPWLGIQSTMINVRDLAEIERAFKGLARNSIGGLVVMPDPITLVHRERIVALVAEQRLPTVYPFRYFANVGGLVRTGRILPTCGGARGSMLTGFSRGLNRRPADPKPDKVRTDRQS